LQRAKVKEIPREIEAVGSEPSVEVALVLETVRGISKVVLVVPE